MNQNSVAKILKYFIWAGLIIVALIPFLIPNYYFFRVDFLYPFIYAKALIFRISVELIFLAYLMLTIFSREYKNKINGLMLIFLIYVVVSFVSSFFGINFYRSFWSSVERQEGLMLLIHLGMFLYVLSNFLTTRKNWLLILDTSIITSILVSLYAVCQFFGWNFFFDYGGGRLESTIGNASYLAGYLMFNILFCLYLVKSRQFNFSEIYYYVVILLEIFVILQSGTRGAFVALLTCVFSLIFFYIIKGSVKARKISVAGLLAVLIFLTLIFSFKDSEFVKSIPTIQRFTTISFENLTTKTRLMTWQEAWQGFIKRPILGYGYENFNYVFNLYFNPEFYEDEGSILWFDRAHNLIFDRLVTGGVIGLWVYLFFVFYPAYCLFKAKNSDENDTSSAYLKLILLLVVVSYFIQNLFVFDHLTTFIPLFFALAFMAFLSGDIKFLEKYKVNLNQPLAVLIVSAIIILPLLYFGSVTPTRANLTASQAVNEEQQGRLDVAIDDYKKAIGYNTYGNQEFRIYLVSLFSNYVSGQENVDYWNSILPDIKQQLSQQIQEQPLNVMNYLLSMRFNNVGRVIDKRLLTDNYDLFDTALKLSPTRPQIYYEMGYTQLYQGVYYKNKGELQLIQSFYKDAINHFKKVLELSPRVIEANTTYVMALINVGEARLAKQQLELMDKNNINYHSEIYLNQLADSAVYFKDYDLVKTFYSELVNIFPDNPQYYMNLALAYAYLRDNEMAIQTAKDLLKLDSQYQDSVNSFIEEVDAGKFKIQE